MDSYDPNIITLNVYTMIITKPSSDNYLVLALISSIIAKYFKTYALKNQKNNVNRRFIIISDNISPLRVVLSNKSMQLWSHELISNRNLRASLFSLHVRLKLKIFSKNHRCFYCYFLKIIITITTSYRYFIKCEVCVSNLDDTSYIQWAYNDS